MMKIMLIILMLFALGLLFFLNLGNFLDTTEEPIKSDIIICFGGGENERIAKAIELYKSSYSTKDILILTGDNRNREERKSNSIDNRFKYLRDNNIDNINIIHERNTRSTKGDIIYTKEYMISNNYKSAIIVSDPYHSRRIQYLAGALSVNHDSDLSFNVVGAKLEWLNSKTFYLTKKGQFTIINEFIKLLGSYIAYGILEKLGILESVSNYTHPMYIKMKYIIKKLGQYYLK